MYKPIAIKHTKFAVTLFNVQLFNRINDTAASLISPKKDFFCFYLHILFLAPLTFALSPCHNGKLLMSLNDFHFSFAQISLLKWAKFSRQAAILRALKHTYTTVHININNRTELFVITKVSKLRRRENVSVVIVAQ